MLARDLVSDKIPLVKGTDPVSQVLDWMAEFKVNQLPVTNQGEYLGLISESAIIDNSVTGQLVGSRLSELLVVSINENQHIYEVIDLMAHYDLTLLPVLSPLKEYRGSITLPLLNRNLSKLTAAGQPGAILVISLASQDYSPTMLSRIIEDNNAKIISLYVVPDASGRELTITIKVTTQETSSMMRSFDRYGYTVKSYYLADSQLDDFYRTRYEEFMKYMNI